MLILTVFMTVSCMFPSLGMVISDIIHDSVMYWHAHFDIVHDNLMYFPSLGMVSFDIVPDSLMYKGALSNGPQIEFRMCILTVFMTISCIFPSLGMLIFDIIDDSFMNLVLSFKLAID